MIQINFCFALKMSVAIAHALVTPIVAIATMLRLGEAARLPGRDQRGAQNLTKPR